MPACAIALLAGGARAETLPLPANLVDFRSEEGEKLLRDSDAVEAFFALGANFVTQKTQAHCGMRASSWSSTRFSCRRRSRPEYDPYRTFTQENVFNAETEKILPLAVLMKQGTTLDQLGQLLALQPVKVEVHHAGDTNLEAFRAASRDYLGEKDHFVIVNYLRKAIGQQLGGHISPLAAYDAEEDRFLILDVARYKYPPVWVKASELFAAMNTTDADNDNKTRGFVLIQKNADATAKSAELAAPAALASVALVAAGERVLPGERVAHDSVEIVEPRPPAEPRHDQGRRGDDRRRDRRAGASPSSTGKSLPETRFTVSITSSTEKPRP